MSYIDIRNYEEDTMYKSIVVQDNKHINLVIIYKTNLNKFIIYRQDFKIMSADYILVELQSIDIVKQKTGFGYKKFFRCPYCGQRRQNLYLVVSELKFACRSCININVFRYRCNLYDANVANVISYKVAKIMRKLKADTSNTNMYNIIKNIPDKPRYMRQEKYELAVKKLYFLHRMWNECMYGRQKYTTRDINRMLEEENDKRS